MEFLGNIISVYALIALKFSSIFKKNFWKGGGLVGFYSSIQLASFSLESDIWRLSPCNPI